MMYDGWGIFGMHGLWWIFWIVVIVALLFFFPRPNQTRRRRDGALELLQRRYAAGEISREEYEERKRTIESDVREGK